MIHDSYKTDAPFRLPLGSNEYEASDFELIDDPTAGVDSDESQTIAFFPSPNAGEFSLIIPPTNGVLKLIIRAIDGQILIIQTVSEGSQLIDIANLADGMYLGQIVDENGEAMYSTFKLIKQAK